MNSNQSPLFWSFPLGTISATRIRVSVYFPLLLLALCLRIDLQIALALTGIFFLSTLFHELFGHVWTARATGGEADEILIWPLGGLAYVRPANTFQSQFLTAAGGPIINLLICLASLPTVLVYHGASPGINFFDPMQLPVFQFSASWAYELILLVFFVNWGLALLNLLPIYPLDGGRMLETTLSDGKRSSQEVKSLCLTVGLITGIFLMLFGLYLDNVWLVLLTSMLLLMAMQHRTNQHFEDQYSDSFMGYDFSQGYTSLEQDEKPSPKSYWERKKEKKEEEKQLQLQQQKEDEERQLDTLLEKINHHGIDSLNAQEKRFLEKTSKNYRSK